MAGFFEDSEPRLLGVESQLLAGVTPANLNRLLTRVRLNVLSEPVPHAVARMIVKLGTTAEPGSVFFGLIRPRFLDVRFRSKRTTEDIDTALQPYYGNIKPGLTELVAAGMDISTTEFWLELFRKDNAIYRIYVVNAMCLAAAIRELS